MSGAPEMTDEAIRRLALLTVSATVEPFTSHMPVNMRDLNALAIAALEARAERDKLQGELIDVLNRETASLVRWEGKLEASKADLSAARAELATVKAERDALAAVKARRSFPILKGEGARVDYQLVADHAEQARKNHYQSVDRLAERGGLSWCELHAVLHNRNWEKMDTNDAMIACRSLEARYLAALALPVDGAPK